ncbi:MAG: menaquinone biosynthesis protein [Chitinophagaceae bacterium]|nr:menaquinone biosynthesis protein [Chitinophagaceae bacterium]
MRRKINQLKKIKVGIVNYLNTMPLLYGINHSPVMDSIELIQDYPSNIASFLLDGKIDIGLVPVAILPALKEYHIYTDYCIGCDGPVASVCLFSEVPIGKVETVLLDYQSRTSVALLKILLNDHWKIKPAFVDTTSDYRSSITGTTAGLVIGDRSFEQRKSSLYAYDLGEAWKQYTGLPFVFAAWVSIQRLDDQFIKAFNMANGSGIENIRTIIDSMPASLFDMEEYFTRYISYELNPEKQRGLERFLELLTH